VASNEVLARVAAGGRLRSWRARPGGRTILVRVDMPDPGSAAHTRAVLTAAGLVVGGNDTDWETQVVFDVPVSTLDGLYPGWRYAAGLGAGPTGSVPAASGRRSLNPG
jgi:hypothetical protein